MNIVIIVPESARQYARELTGISETTTDELGNVKISLTPSDLFSTEMQDESGNKFYISSGEFYERELNALLNSNCEHFVYFGEASEAIKLRGLSVIEQ